MPQASENRIRTEADFSIEYHIYRDEILKAIDRVLSGGRYILGKEVEKFEERFADFIGCKYAIGVGNGYDALFLSYYILGANASKRVGIINQLHISSENAAKILGASVLHTSKTTDLPHCDILTLVHNPVTSYPELPKHENIIEDACQTIGHKYPYKIGSIGKLACFSFHPLKVLHCYGDGGAITTNSEQLYKELKELRNHGRIGKSFIYNIGVNSRLDELQACILNVYLDHIEEIISDSRNRC